MVGIHAGREFKELHNVDQFALCGISPTTRLTFRELRKQAIRVSVLLHDDFKRPQGIVPPFSSAVANDLKSWLQAQAGDWESRAVRLFYANSTGHRGLVWQPFLKGSDGNLLSRTDPAIWQRPKCKPDMPSGKPKKKRVRPEPDKEENFVHERKRRAYASTPGTEEDFRRWAPPHSPTPSADNSSSTDSGDAAGYSIEKLFAPGRLAGRPTGRGIAVACLPDHQGRIVTISLDTKRRLRFRVESIDVKGHDVGLPDLNVGKMTFARLTRERHVFLGRFVGVTALELHHFAWAMDFGFDLPFGDRSPEPQTRK